MTQEKQTAKLHRKALTVCSMIYLGRDSTRNASAQNGGSPSQRKIILRVSKVCRAGVSRRRFELKSTIASSLISVSEEFSPRVVFASSLISAPRLVSDSDTSCCFFYRNPVMVRSRNRQRTQIVWKDEENKTNIQKKCLVICL